MKPFRVNEATAPHENADAPVLGPPHEGPPRPLEGPIPEVADAAQHPHSKPIAWPAAGGPDDRKPFKF